MGGSMEFCLEYKMHEKFVKWINVRDNTTSKITFSGKELLSTKTLNYIVHLPYFTCFYSPIILQNLLQFSAQFLTRLLLTEHMSIARMTNYLEYVYSYFEENNFFDKILMKILNDYGMKLWQFNA